MCIGWFFMQNIAAGCIKSWENININMADILKSLFCIL